MKKFAEIEGLRGIAILLVLLFHLEETLAPSGFVGVDVFFVISGFVIFSSVLGRENKGGNFSFRGFTLRRLRRLTPTILVGFILTLPLLAWSQSPLGAFDNSVLTGLSSIIGVSNGVIQYLSGGYFGDTAEVNGYLHTWSLSVEIQFYLVFAILMTTVYSVLKRKMSSARALRIVAVIVSVPSIAVLMTSFATSLPFEELGVYGYYSPLVRAWQFGIGGLLATVTTPEISPKGKNVLSTAALLTIFLLSLTDFHQSTIFGTFLPSGIASVAAALLIFTSKDKVFTGHILTSKPLLHLGKVSYALYVVHWPVMVAANALDFSFALKFLALLGAYLLSVLIYEGLEKPIGQKRLLPLSSIGAQSKTLAVLVIASLGLVTQNAAVGNSPEVEKLKSQVQERHLPAQHDWLCATGPLTVDNYERCLIGVTDTDNPPIYLVGDSQAGMYSEAMLSIAKSMNTSLVMSTTTACPFYSSDNSSERCNDFVLGSTEFLLNSSPGRVVIAFAQQPGISENARSFEELILKLTDYGHEVFLMEAVPHIREFNPLGCSLGSVMTVECFPSISSSEADDKLAQIDELFRNAESKELAKVLQTRDLVCEGGQCQTMRKGVAIYRDSSHLSVASAELLAPHLRSQLLE